VSAPPTLHDLPHLLLLDPLNHPLTYRFIQNTIFIADFPLVIDFCLVKASCFLEQNLPRIRCTHAASFDFRENFVVRK
jgi:hypothetical protein